MPAASYGASIAPDDLGSERRRVLGRESLEEKSYRHRTFTYSGCSALGGAVADFEFK